MQPRTNPSTSDQENAAPNPQRPLYGNTQRRPLTPSSEARMRRRQEGRKLVHKTDFFHVNPSIVSRPALPKIDIESPKLNTLNMTQRMVIEGTINYILSDIADSQPLSVTVKLLSSLLHHRIVPSFTDDAFKYETQGSISQLHAILAHPTPQNRNVGDGNAFNAKVLKGRDPIDEEEVKACRTGIYRNTVYYFKSGFGSEVLTESEGKIGLTALVDSTTPSPTKQDVVTAIQGHIQTEILKHQTTAATKIQFWYKRTRDENNALAMIEHPEQSLLANKIRQRRRARE